jgi:FTR1 family protein
VLVGLLSVPTATAAAPNGSLEDQLDRFRGEVQAALSDYEDAYANYTAAEDEDTRQQARDAMVQAGRDIGQAFLAFERGHGEDGSLSVFMETQMDQGFYRSFEQDLVLLRATMMDAAEGEVPTPEEVDQKASPVLSAFDRAETCIPEGCGSTWTGAAAQSFLVLLREGFEAVLLVGAIVTYLHKSDRSEKVREVLAGVGLAVLATLATWFAFDRLFASAAARGSVAQATLEAVTLLLASAILFYVGFWLLSRIESERWRAFIDGKLEDSLSDDRAWMLVLVGFLAVFREGVETVVFVQAIAIGSGQAWSQIALGLGLAVVALAALYYAFQEASVRVPLRTFFGATSAILCLLSIRFLGLGLFELQEAGWLAATPLETVNAFFVQHGLARTLAGVAFGFSPTFEVLVGQAILVAVIAAGAAWTFVWRPARAETATA